MKVDYVEMSKQDNSPNVTRVGKDGVTRQYKHINDYAKLGCLERVIRLIAVIVLGCLIFPLCTSTFWDFVYEVKTGKRLVAVYKEIVPEKPIPSKILEDAEKQRAEIIYQAKVKSEKILDKAIKHETERVVVVHQAKEEAKKILEKAKKTELEIIQNAKVVEAEILNKNNKTTVTQTSFQTRIQRLREFDKKQTKESDDVVAILCKNGEKRYAQKCLVTLSPYFEQEFSGPWKNTKNETDVLKDHPDACVDLFLDLLYGAPVSGEISISHLMHLIIIADGLHLPELRNDCKAALGELIQSNPSALTQAWLYEDQNIVKDERIEDYLTFWLKQDDLKITQADQLIQYFQKRSDSKDLGGHYLLGLCCFKGIGVEKDLNKALKYYEEAVLQGYAPAQHSLAGRYFDGEVVKKDIDQAVQLYQSAADQGYSPTLNYLGSMYQNGTGVEKNLKKAVELYEEASFKGCVWAYTALAKCYENGTGVEKDHVKAEELYKKSALQGFCEEQHNLGIFYLKNFEDKHRKVFKYFEKSASHGYGPALGSLGDCYHLGQGVKKSDIKAIESYEKGAAKNDFWSQFKLGLQYQMGTFVTKDLNKAFDLFSRSAEQNCNYAQYYLGDCHERGQGVSEDLNMAIKYYRLAAKQGLDIAITRLQNLGVPLDAE